MTEPALSLNGIVKRFGRRRALDDITLRIPRGSITGLVGSNGAGKTTTMAVATGLLRHDAGTVDLLGDGPFSADRHAGRVTLMPQDSDLPSSTPVLELLTFYGELQGLSRAEARTQSAQAIEWVHLADRARSSIRTLSHGMRRRVVVAQAFLGTPELVLLDEPMSGLDPLEVVNIRKLISSRRGKQTLVVSSHNLHELERVCDHVVFIEKGKVVREGPMEQVTARHRSVEIDLAEAAELPLDELRARLPGSEITFAQERRRVVITYEEGDMAAAEVNSLALPWLIDKGAAIQEVRRGADLEDAYLDHHGKTPAPPGA